MSEITGTCTSYRVDHIPMNEDNLPTDLCQKFEDNNIVFKENNFALKTTWVAKSVVGNLES